MSITRDDFADAVKVMAPLFDAALPYAGSSGHSGTDTSAERAEHEDSTGITGARQRRIFLLLQAAGLHGATWREVADVTGLHHGQVSGALTVLHKTGRIERLALRRGRCKVYVHPDYVGGREVESHQRNRNWGALDAATLRAVRELAWDEGNNANRITANPYRHRVTQ